MARCRSARTISRPGRSTRKAKHGNATKKTEVNAGVVSSTPAEAINDSEIDNVAQDIDKRRSAAPHRSSSIPLAEKSDDASPLSGSTSNAACSRVKHAAETSIDLAKIEASAALAAAGDVNVYLASRVFPAEADEDNDARDEPEIWARPVRDAWRGGRNRLCCDNF